MHEDPKRHLSVVTGATSGIGRAVAQELVAHGHELLVVSRGGEGLAALERELRAVAGPGALTSVVADLADDTAAAAVAAAVRHDGRRVGVVVHSAGVVGLGPLEEGVLGAYDRQMAVNTRAPLALTVALLPYLADGTAQIVFVNSGAGLRANANWGAYAASKHALRALADSLRDELRPRGIRVASLFPGRTDSPMQREVHASEGKPYDASKLLAPGDVASVLRTVLELPPSAEVGDVTIRPTGFA